MCKDLMTGFALLGQPMNIFSIYSKMYYQFWVFKVSDLSGSLATRLPWWSFRRLILGKGLLRTEM